MKGANFNTQFKGAEIHKEENLFWQRKFIAKTPTQSLQFQSFIILQKQNPVFFKTKSITCINSIQPITKFILKPILTNHNRTPSPTVTYQNREPQRIAKPALIVHATNNSSKDESHKHNKAPIQHKPVAKNQERTWPQSSTEAQRKSERNILKPQPYKDSRTQQTQKIPDRNSTKTNHTRLVRTSQPDVSNKKPDSWHKNKR